MCENIFFNSLTDLYQRLKCGNAFVLLTILSVLCLCSCASKPASESVQYKELRQSFFYKTYRGLSKKTIDPTLGLYNEKLRKEGHTEIHASLVHSVLGVSHLIAQEADWAIVEANLGHHSAANREQEYISTSLLALGFYGKGWHKLGGEYSAKSKLLSEGLEYDETYKVPRILGSSFSGLIAVREGKGQAAEDAFQVISEASDQHWLPITAHAAALLMSWPSTDTVRGIEHLLAREDLSYEARQRIEVLKAKASTRSQKYSDSEGDPLNEVLMQWTMDALKEVPGIAMEAIVEVVAKIYSAILVSK